MKLSPAMAVTPVGYALYGLATSSERAEQKQLYSEAVSAYRMGLEVRTRERHPDNWAIDQHGLSGALLGLAISSEGAERQRLLGDPITSPVQFCGEGLTLDAQGRWLELPNLRDHLLAKPSLHDRLEALRSQLTPDEVRHSIWLVHCPPAELAMDICYDGRQVGFPTILRFIHDAQRLLGCSGHIHEAPYQPGGK